MYLTPDKVGGWNVNIVSRHVQFVIEIIITHGACAQRQIGGHRRVPEYVAAQSQFPYGTLTIPNSLRWVETQRYK